MIERAAQDQVGDLSTLNTITNIWLNYERCIKEAPEWPFTSTMLRKLLVSTLIPIAFFTLQRLAIETALKWIPKP